MKSIKNTFVNTLRKGTRGRGAPKEGISNITTLPRGEDSGEKAYLIIVTPKKAAKSALRVEVAAPHLYHLSLLYSAPLNYPPTRVLPISHHPLKSTAHLAPPLISPDRIPHGQLLHPIQNAHFPSPSLLLFLKIFAPTIIAMAGTVETQTPTPVEPRSRMETHRLNFDLADSAVAPPLKKRCRKVDAAVPALHKLAKIKRADGDSHECPKFGVTSVCGRRRDMEDAVAIRPSFCGRDSDIPGGLHFFGVFDGHGCSHVARRCKERLHEIVRDEYENGGASSWEDTMSRSFMTMDEDVTEWSSGRASTTSRCRCEMQTPQRDSVGSTAVVAVVSPDKIVLSNCGDSRALLCRNGVAIPLSVDHKVARVWLYNVFVQ